MIPQARKRWNMKIEKSKDSQDKESEDKSWWSLAYWENWESPYSEGLSTEIRLIINGKYISMH